MPACRRHYPGRTERACSLVLPSRLRPSPTIWRVSSCVKLFRGLLSVHSRYGLQTRGVAYRDPFHRRLQRLRYLHRRPDCYRVERTSSRGRDRAAARALCHKDQVTFPRAPLQSRKVGFPDSGFGLGFPRVVFPNRWSLSARSHTPQPHTVYLAARPDIHGSSDFHR